MEEYALPALATTIFALHYNFCDVYAAGVAHKRYKVCTLLVVTDSVLCVCGVCVSVCACLISMNL